MRNLKSGRSNQPRLFLLYGPAGAMKTRLISCFPAPYVADFDNKLFSLEGSDVLAESFVSHFTPSSGKGRQDSAIIAQESGVSIIVDFEQRLRGWGKFKEREDRVTFAIDSLTLYSDALLRRVQALNQTANRPPDQNTFRIQMDAIMNTISLLRSMNNPVIVTAHETELKDESSGQVLKMVPLVTGKLKDRLSAYFTDVYHAERRNIKGKTTAIFTTSGSGMYETRCSFKDMPAKLTFDELAEFLQEHKSLLGGEVNQS